MDMISKPTSFIAITLIELPSAVVLILFMDIWGRKPLMVKSKLKNQQCTQFQNQNRLPPFSCLALPALLLECLRRFLSMEFHLDDKCEPLKGPVFTLCVLFGKFCAAGAFTILHIATAELYPTAIRLNFVSNVSSPEECF